MRRVLLLSICALIASGAMAASVTVPGDFATVGAAVTAVLADPVSNEVVVDPGTYAETAGVAIVANSADDTQITVRASNPANRPVLVLGPTSGQPNSGLDGRGIAISIAAYVPTPEVDWTVTLQDLVLIPEAGNAPSRGIYANTNSLGLSPTARQTINISGVLISANNGSDVPLSTDGLALQSIVGATLFTDDGIFLTGREAAATISDTVVTHLAGVNPDAVVYFPDDPIGDGSTLTINGPCTFSYTDRIGIQVASDGANVTIAGTAVDPVIIAGTGSAFGGGNTFNGALAMFADDNASGTSAYDIDRLIVADNNHTGIDVFFVDTGQSVPAATMNDVIFGNNGGANTSHGITIEDDLLNTWTLTDVTIANSFGATALLGGANSTGTVNFTGCILAGSENATVGGGNDEAIDVGGIGYAVNITDSAVVTLGPHAGAGVQDNSGSTATINQTNVTALDPAFIDTVDYTDGFSGDYFDVDNVQYGNRGVGGGPLSGGGDFIGGGVPAELSIFTTD